ncbi:MAG: methylmalonyl Co-A mutase-associated GTPase MeaB [Cyclobacteriaceae bacterium]
MARARLSLEDYRRGILGRDRFILSRAITLVESSRPQDQELSEALLEALIPFSGFSLRIGITGVPGVGKSTFINALGSLLVAKGHRLAVLSVDPSSEKSRGSILGDKTRMPILSRQENAYIRPSAAGSTLGGVARKTRESMLLCEAAGYDIIFVETVGVGQSETAVYKMVDCFLLLMLAGAGDELQGIKRGIMEMSDMLVINKADGDNQEAARRARKEYINALHLFPASESGFTPQVLTCSALQQQGLEEVWHTVLSYEKTVRGNGYLEQRRKSQRLQWLHESISHQLQALFYKQADIREKLQDLEKEVLEGRRSPTHAANQLIRLFNS